MSNPKELKFNKKHMSMRVSELDMQTIEAGAKVAADAGLYKTSSKKGYNVSKFILYLVYDFKKENNEKFNLNA